MRIALTGVTGILGRNILFELIKKHLSQLDALSVIVLGRGKKEQAFAQRVHEILLEDGLDYLGLAGESAAGDLLAWLNSGLECVEMDLKRADLALSAQALECLLQRPIDAFIHSAAVTDFRHTEEAGARLEESNVRGTARILELVRALPVAEFDYISTAYASGTTVGTISPDYINLDQSFKNPYERSKLQAELLVREFARGSRLRFRYFRPTTICGRLLEPPPGSIPKFNVFYAWAAFMLYSKITMLGRWDNLYDEPFELPCRVCYSSTGALNIIPADYIAKVIVQALQQRDEHENYHIANPHDTAHSLYVPLMLEVLNISGVKAVAQVPDDLDDFESLYYAMAGDLFTPYVISDARAIYDTTSLEPVLKRANLCCPPIDRENFLVLMDYAKKRDFGLQLEPALA